MVPSSTLLAPVQPERAAVPFQGAAYTDLSFLYQPPCGICQVMMLSAIVLSAVSFAASPAAVLSQLLYVDKRS